MIEFPEGTNKVVVNTELAIPELQQKIINFANYMYREDDNGIYPNDCYAIVESIGWDDDALHLTKKGIEYLKSIVKDYVQEDIERIYVGPENSDNIYCICDIVCYTANYTYEFRAQYCLQKEPYKFSRVLTKAEHDRIYPHQKECAKTIEDCFRFANIVRNYDDTNQIAVKMAKAIQKKYDATLDKSWEMDAKAYDEIRSQIPDELFSIW